MTLPETLRELIELLAKNTHEVWARQRLADGWTWGPTRDDGKKQHPCLVPYEELPESEKTYDRRSATETLKTILGLGFSIESPLAVPPARGTPEDDIPRVLDPAADLTSCLTLWRERTPERRVPTPEFCQRLGERILELGEPLLAYDVVVEGLSHWPHDARLRQLQALALVRSGVTHRAREILKELQREGNRDEETVGILARISKDEWETATEPAEREAKLRLAADAYQDAYRQAGGCWIGINAATMAMLLGDRDRAKALARQVRDQCHAELARLEDSHGDAYWPLATLGEAALILGDHSAAETWYGKAAEVGRGRFGNLSSTRHQARYLIRHLGIDGQGIERCLRIPRVVVFAGHMVDQPGRAQPRFPPQLERAVFEAIRDRLKTLDAGFGYASASCGADILFLEAILESKGETHVVLPYQQSEFKNDSVDIIPDADWSGRYEWILDRAADTVIASEQRLVAGTVTYDFANLFLHGLATIRARQLETQLVPLAVWDGRLGDGLGGTASIVQRWRDFGHQVEVIDLAELLRAAAPRLAATSATAATVSPPHPAQRALPFSREIRAMVFADAAAYSKLTEEQLPLFVPHFLGPIAEITTRFEGRLLSKRTAGDSLFAVFSSVAAAGEFALALRHRFHGVRWTDFGLPESLGIRIALDVGPVYSYVDPVVQRLEFCGAHVNRAARIEPITPAGHVYASRSFAALAAAQGIADFLCDYVGQVALPKGYGTFPLYQVRHQRR